MFNVPRRDPSDSDTDYENRGDEWHNPEYLTWPLLNNNREKTGQYLGQNESRSVSRAEYSPTASAIECESYLDKSQATFLSEASIFFNANQNSGYILPLPIQCPYCNYYQQLLQLSASQIN